MKKQPYGKSYIPSAPVLPVCLAPLLDKKHVALVDTGADGTFVPTEILNELDAVLLYMTNVRSHFSERLQQFPLWLRRIAKSSEMGLDCQIQASKAQI
jgi:hypothetical protein